MVDKKGFRLNGFGSENFRPAFCRLPSRLLHQVGHIRQHGQMAGALDGGGDAALVFQAVARDAARQQFALLVDKLEQEIGVFVVDMFNAELAETAIFFVFQPDFRVAEKFDIFSGSSHIFDFEWLKK
jgi:hypothetical protein